MALEFLALRLDTLKHGDHLGIGVLIATAWVVQIHLLQRRDDGTGLAARHKKREYRTRCCDKQHRRHQRKQNRRDARLGLCQTNNLTVIKGDGAI